MRFIVRPLITLGANIAALAAAAAIVSGISYNNSFWTLVIAGAVFGLVNHLVKPIIKFFSLPFIFLTLGLVLFAINILMLYITSWIVGKFNIASFSDALEATIIIWAVNFALSIVFRDVEKKR